MLHTSAANRELFKPRKSKFQRVSIFDQFKIPNLRKQSLIDHFTKKAKETEKEVTSENTSNDDKYATTELTRMINDMYRRKNEKTDTISKPVSLNKKRTNVSNVRNSISMI